MPRHEAGQGTASRVARISRFLRDFCGGEALTTCLSSFTQKRDALVVILGA